MFIPTFGVTGAALFLGEQLTPVQFMGGIIILAALTGAYRASAP
jgi:drug/metabolite transporter (DMT)-like permease